MGLLMYLLHQKMHQWLARLKSPSPPAAPAVVELNEHGPSAEKGAPTDGARTLLKSQ